MCSFAFQDEPHDDDGGGKIKSFQMCLHDAWLSDNILIFVIALSPAPPLSSPQPYWQEDYLISNEFHYDTVGKKSLHHRSNIKRSEGKAYFLTNRFPKSSHIQNLWRMIPSSLALHSIVPKCIPRGFCISFFFSWEIKLLVLITCIGLIQIDFHQIVVFFLKCYLVFKQSLVTFYLLWRSCL